MSDDKEIKIKIDLETYRKLQDQLEQMKLVSVPGIEICDTVEDLVSFYIKQIFRMDTFLLEGIMSIFKKYSSDNKFHQAFREILEGSKMYDNADSAPFNSIFDDEEEDDEDFEDEFFYYEEEDEEFEESDKLERVDINSEEYKERQRKYEEEKKKNKK